MTNRTRVMMVVLFLVSFAAGLGTATVFRPLPPPAPRGGGPGWLSSELGLTPDQQKEMKRIWDNVRRPNWQEDMKARDAIAKQRDDEIRQLIPTEKQAEFDAINERSAKEFSAIRAKGREAFEAAVKETKAILNPEQQKKYDEIMSRPSDGRRGPGGPGDGPRGMGDGSRGSRGPDHEHRRPPGASTAPSPADAPQN